MNDHPALDPQDEAFIDEALKSGRYASRAEVLREGLPVVRERQAQWARFDAEIQKGIDSLDCGEGIPWRKRSPRCEPTLSKRGAAGKTPREGRPVARSAGGPEGHWPLDHIRAAVARGKADVEAGRTLDAAKAFAELETYFRSLARGDTSD